VAEIVPPVALDDDARVLIVDDTRLDRELLTSHLKRAGYEIETAADGVEALERLEKAPSHFDVVLLDRSMPRMDGLGVLRVLKQHARLRMLPVILQTASTAREHMVEGIKAGAYYYLTKPYDVEMLLSVVATAARDYAHYKEVQAQLRSGLKVLRLLRDAQFEVRTVDEARDIAGVLANACPDPMSTVVGLTELLVNAVEHGSLGITYDEKSELCASGTWEEEVKRRLSLPENASKSVFIRFERVNGEIRFTITDPGTGFDWQRFLEVDPQRAFDNHGRGIAMAKRLSFSKIEYRGCGNEVVGTVRV
jgi:CheY-like chemotaxis protein/anti-sigma regulatory factor (Ser/Thr protein kinase)